MDWHPLVLMRLVFVALVGALIVISLTTNARARTPREWALVKGVLILLAWALLGFAFVRA